MILILHPEQVKEILDLAAELGVDPEVVLAERGPLPQTQAKAS